MASEKIVSAPANDSLAQLTEAVRTFAADRDWDQFHTPKNLAMAMMVEAAEVAEHFQWSEAGEEISPAKRDAVAMEIADVLLYLLRLADRLHIDPIVAARDKMRINAERYPADKAFGKSSKYTEL